MTKGSKAPKDLKLAKAAARRGRPPRRQPRARRKDGTDTVIFGFDTEYVAGAGQPAKPGGPPGNFLLCYSFCLINPETGAECVGIHHLWKNDRRERVNFGTLVKVAVSRALADGVIDAPPQFVHAVAHFARADLSGFRDYPKLKSKIDAIQKTQATTTQPYPVNLHGTDQASVYFYDTTLLAPEGSKSLAELGAAMSMTKRALAQGDIERMDLLRERDIEMFVDYAIHDARIAAHWALRFGQIVKQEFGIGVLPVSASAASVAIFRGVLGEDGQKITKMIQAKEKGPDKKSRLVPVYVDQLLLFTTAYHGGRNESYMTGITPSGNWTDFDLAGAYTTQMAAVREPDWSATRATTELATLAKLDVMSAARVRFEFPPNTRFPGLPVPDPDERGLVFPLTGETVATGPELAVAAAMGAKIEVLAGAIVPWASDYRPLLKFSILIAAKRGQHDKRTLENKVIKLIGNSLYGKTAQGVSANKAIATGRRPPTHLNTRTGLREPMGPSAVTNAAIASYITGGVRAVLTEILNRLPDDADVVSATTDGLITNAPELEIDFTAPAARFFRDLRKRVAGSEEIIEVKGRARQMLALKTRGAAVFKRDTSWTGGPILAKAGHKLPDPPKNEWIANRQFVRLALGRKYGDKFLVRSFTSLAAQYEADADLGRIERDVSTNLDPDFKRRPTDIGEREGRLFARSEPWNDINEFNDFRSAWDSYRHAQKAVMKTVTQFEAFLECLATQANSTKAGLRQKGTDPIATILLRGLSAGSFGIKPKPCEIFALADKIGVRYTRSMHKRARERTNGTIPDFENPLNSRQTAILKATKNTFPEADFGPVVRRFDSMSKA